MGCFYKSLFACNSSGSCELDFFIVQFIASRVRHKSQNEHRFHEDK